MTGADRLLRERPALAAAVRGAHAHDGHWVWHAGLRERYSPRW